jgi:hypothetical protein
LPDEIAGAEVPVDIGILEREQAQQKRQQQEEGDQASVRYAGDPGRAAGGIGSHRCGGAHLGILSGCWVNSSLSREQPTHVRLPLFPRRTALLEKLAA